MFDVILSPEVGKHHNLRSSQEIVTCEYRQLGLECYLSLLLPLGKTPELNDNRVLPIQLGREHCWAWWLTQREEVNNYLECNISF